MNTAATDPAKLSGLYVLQVTCFQSSSSRSLAFLNALDVSPLYWFKHVEDVMYHTCIKFQNKHMMHSFIYNADNIATTSLFTPEENKEIQDTNKKPNLHTFTPKTGLFVQYFSKFKDISDLEELKQALFNTCHLELFKTKNNEQWMCQVFHSFLYDTWLNALKNDPCFSLNLLESWILSNPWHFVQILFLDHKDIFVIGGEKGSLASQVRKDASRKVGGLTAMSRQLIGKKGDGYVCFLGSDARGVAAIEAGPKWEGPGATKVLVKTEKILQKALLDIFLVMHNRLGNSVDMLNKLAVPDLAIYGDKCKQLKPDHVGGYVTRVVSTEWMNLSMCVSGCVIDRKALFVEVFIF
ncbi:hypothetical protein HDU78_005268 [Chytriomyces hyalinus]|nr:hypothetical protein HDU78_005268 [Chytriomyces hyalinus]